MHLGVILPNYGAGSTPAGIRRVVELAESLGYDSVWVTEHILVGPEAADPYGRVYDPLVTLGWIAALTERIELGTSIVLVPLHNPVLLAKQAATLQELSGGRLRLGVGMGWHEDEFRFVGAEFRGRGRRADEALRLIRALWAGEREFHGEHWSFADATFGPLPEPPPEIWVGGAGPRTIRRALELGDVWHPSLRTTPDDVRRIRAEHPGLRIVARTRPDRVDALVEAGVEGVVVDFGGAGSGADARTLRDFARRYR